MFQSVFILRACLALMTLLVALTGPLTLVRYDNGRIAIHDPSTGWSADLMGFGIDNAKAFARLLAQ